MANMLRIAPALIASLYLATGLSGSAAAHDIMPPGSRAAALGGAMVSNCESGNAAWYNPALLTVSNEFKFSLQYSALFPRTNAKVEQYGSLGFIPYMQAHDANGNLSYSKTRLRIDKLFSADAEPDTLDGFNVQLLLPLKRMIPKFPIRVGFGAMIFAPCAGSCVVKVNAHTSDQPFYPVFGSRSQRLHVLLGVGIEILEDLLSIGAAVSILADMSGNVGSLTPISTFDADNPGDKQPGPSKATFSQDLGTSATPVLGALVRPLDELRIGAYYRFAQRLGLQFAVDAGVAVDMGFPLESQMPYTLESNFFYVPASTGIGIGATLGDRLLLTGQVDWVFWSGVADNINISDFDVDPEVVNDIGGLTTMEEYGDFRVRQLPPPHIKARDIIVPRLGAEYALMRGYTRLRLGWSYTPSALEPDQQFGNLLLDNSYHTVSSGLGMALADPLGYMELPVLIDVHFLVSILQPRYQRVGLEDSVAGYHAMGLVKTDGYFFGFGLEATFQL